jgi:serine/threonine protein kinase
MLPEGTLLQNRYRIIEPIGHGGMGAVYKARHEGLGKIIAIKEAFHTNDDRLRRAFDREAKTLARLHNKGLPLVTDNFSEGEGLFLVMEYISGDDLLQRLSDGDKAFSVEQVTHWAEELLEILTYLHNHNPPVVHCDIKPGNIKLKNDGQVVLLDFGFSKGTVSERAATMASRSVLGFTLAYSPLEQILKVDQNVADHLSILDHTKVDHIRKTPTNASSDIYALGATLYHLLTNKQPVPSPTRALAIWSGKADPLIPANNINPQVTAAMGALLQEAMALDNEKRFASATKMGERLKEVHGIDLQTTKRYPDPPPLAPRKRSVHFMLPIAAALLVIIAGSLLIFNYAGKAQRFLTPTLGEQDQKNDSNSPKVVLPIAANLEDSQLIPFRKGNKWGFSDVNKHILIEARYDGAERFSEGMAKVWLEDRNDAATQPQGTKVKLKYGFIDKTGKEVIKVQFDSADPFKQGWTKVTRYGTTRYFNKDGDEIPRPSPTPYRPSVSNSGSSKPPALDSSSLSLQWDEYTERYGFVDSNGRFVIRPVYEDAGSFSGRIAPVKRREKWGFIDATNTFVLQPIYDYASKFSDGLCVVGLNGKYGFIDTNGSVAIPLIFDYAEPFYSGAAKVKIGDKFGYIDKMKNEVIKIKYEDVDRFSEDLAKIKLSGKYGFMDRTEKIVINAKYDNAKPFAGGLAEVQLNGVAFYIGRDGTEYYEP